MVFQKFLSEKKPYNFISWDPDAYCGDPISVLQVSFLDTSSPHISLKARREEMLVNMVEHVGIHTYPYIDDKLGSMRVKFPFVPTIR